MQETARLNLVIDASKADATLNRVARKTEGLGQTADRAGKRMSDAFEKARRSIFSMQGAMVGLAIGSLIKQTIDLNNTYLSLTNRLKLVTDGTENLAYMQDRLFDVAQRSRGALDGTINTYSRLARTTKQLGLDQETLIGVTETINKAVAISGGTAESTAAALFQLGQGLAADALRGQELNSVLEQTPRLAEALASGLGVSIGQLRSLGEEGKITAKKVIEALQNQSQAVDSEFDRTTKTVSQAMQQLENVFLRTIGELDASELTSSIDEFTRTISDPQVTQGLQTLASGLLNIVNLLTKAAAGLGEFGKSIGEVIAMQVVGVIEDPFEREQRAIERAKFEIESYRKQQAILNGQITESANALQILTNAGVNPASEAYKYHSSRVQALGAEYADLNARIQENQSIIKKTGELGKNTADVAGTDGEPAIPAGMPEGGLTEKEIERLQTRYERLQESFMSETELALNEYNRRNELINTLEQEKIVADEEARQLRLESMRAYEEQLTAIVDEEAMRRQAIEQQVAYSIVKNYAAAASSAASIIKDLGSKSKTAAIAALLIEKGAAAASVMANAEAAKFQIMATTPPYAWPSLIASVEANRVLSLAAIAASTISGISKSGGGGSPAGGSIGGSASATPVSSNAREEARAPTPRVQVVVSGGLHSDNDVRSLIERISEVQKDLGTELELTVA